jgi:hypothetical protein
VSRAEWFDLGQADTRVIACEAATVRLVSGSVGVCLSMRVPVSDHAWSCGHVSLAASLCQQCLVWYLVQSARSGSLQERQLAVEQSRGESARWGQFAYQWGSNLVQRDGSGSRWEATWSSCKTRAGQAWRRGMRQRIRTDLSRVLGVSTSTNDQVRDVMALALVAGQ